MLLFWLDVPTRKTQKCLVEAAYQSVFAKPFMPMKQSWSLSHRAIIEKSAIYHTFFPILWSSSRIQFIQINASQKITINSFIKIISAQ